MLTAGIYKHGRKCANGGISDRHDLVTVVNAEGPDDRPMPNAPPVILVSRRDGDCVAYPASKGENGWEVDGGQYRYMFGGTYIATSDSRFSDAVQGKTGGYFYGAIPLHDRKE